MLLLRALTRVVGMIWLLALALLGLGIALYCLGGLVRLGSVRPDRLIGLAGIHRHVGRSLDQLAAPGPTAGLALLYGLGAMLIGVLLLAGVLRSRKQPLAILEGGTTSGVLAAKPGPLREMARALAEQTSGATSVKRPKLTLSRRGTRGRLKVTASRHRTSERDEVQRAVTTQLEPISGPFNLKARVRVHVGQPGERGQ